MQEQIPESFGGYTYFIKEKEYPQQIKRELKASDEQNYITYNRVAEHSKTEANSETVLDIVEDLVRIGFVPHRFVKSTVVDKIKMSKDHSLVAFTVDIGNTERLTGGVKDMRTGTVLANVKLQNVSCVEFANDGQHLYFVESDKVHNRPYTVKRINLESGEVQALFIDDDPTHYVDITLSKDKQFLFINSGTKEDSEVWVVDNRWSPDNLNVDIQPKLLIKRQQEVRVHVEHVRDFFLRISNNDVASKNFKLQTLRDDHLSLGSAERGKAWEDLLAPGHDDSLIISEFDCFQDFIAVYVRMNNRPQIIVQDLDSLEFKTIEVNDGDIGEIEPMLNQEYARSTLRFAFSSPFIYQ